MDFKTFLKKHSTINSKFLDDFYEIINEKHIAKYYDFIIDGENLRKILKIKNRENFLITLKRSYVKNIDYKIYYKKKTEGSGGHNFKIIMLTPKASRKFCLLTHSPMRAPVQQYFLELEIILYKYKNYIIDGLNKHKTT